MSGIVLPAEYGYVGAAIVAITWLTLWQATNVAFARRLAKIEYPQMYAEKAEAKASPDAHRFNCAQRAHQNTLESVTSIVSTTAFMGLVYPRVAAGACAAWILSRVIYAVGYSTGDPKNRISGSRISLLAGLVLLFGSSWTAVEFIKATL